MKALFKAVFGFQFVIMAALVAELFAQRWLSLTIYWISVPILGVVVWRYFPCSPTKKVLMFFAFNFALATLWNNDLALVSSWLYDGGATLPYGSLWFVLNPFWHLPNTITPPNAPPWNLDYHAYLWYLFGFQALFLALMLKMKNTFSRRYVFWTQIFNAMLVVIHNPQSIVPMQFVYLAPLSIAMFSIAAVVKLPFGWPGGWSNPHVQCIFGGVGNYNPFCGPAVLWSQSLPTDLNSGGFNPTYNMINYAAVAIVCFLVLKYWFGMRPRRIKIPLPRARCIAINLNGKKLVFGIALWKGRQRKAIITNVFPCPFDAEGMVQIADMEGVAKVTDSLAVLDDIRNNDNHGRE